MATEQERERRMYESAAELWRMATGEAVRRGARHKLGLFRLSAPASGSQRATTSW